MNQKIFFFVEIYELAATTTKICFQKDLFTHNLQPTYQIFRKSSKNFHFFSITYQTLSNYTLSIGCQLLQPPHTYQLRKRNLFFPAYYLNDRQICLPKPAFCVLYIHQSLITFINRAHLPQGNFSRNQLFDSSIDLSPLYMFLEGI